MNEPLIRLAARVERDGFVLYVDINVASRVLGIVGPSGSGKSTLIGVASGLVRARRCELLFQGQTWASAHDRTELPANQRGVGLVPQEGLLFPHWDVQRNLGAGRHRGCEPTASEIEAMAQRLGIAELLPRSVTSLSGGQRQRVSLGRALLSAPRWLLLDEPLGALDYARRRALLPLLRNIVDTTDLPLWFVSHDFAEVTALCDEVIVMEQGKVVAQGNPRSLALASRWGSVQEGRHENLLRAEVEGADADISVVTVGPQTRIFARSVNVRSGQSVFISLFADDIMIAIERPQGLSARNVLPVRVSRMPTQASPFVSVQLARGPSLWVQLAESTIAELGLCEGADVFAVFKASSCRIWADSPDAQVGCTHP